jgi:hypothetical protein
MLLRPPLSRAPWKELDEVDGAAGGAPRAHRDALKLLAVFLQHSDNKAEQQRLVCLGAKEAAAEGACARPFMMINDLGLTFGRATAFKQKRDEIVNRRCPEA